MWKILGLLVFCGLLSPSVGKVPGIRSVFSQGEINKVIETYLKQNDILLNHVKGILFADIKLEGLLGLIGNIVNLKIANAQITGSVAVLHQDKVELTLSLHLEITGTAILTTTSVIAISLDVSFKVIYGVENYSQGIVDIVFYECGGVFGAININLLGGLLPPIAITTIQQSIIADINRQACSILKVAFDVIKVTVLDTLNVDIPLGIHGNLKLLLAALPVISEAYVGLDLYVDFHVAVSGVIISIPETAVSINVPLLHNYRHCLAIHAAGLNIVLSVLAPKQPKELSCTPDAYSKADELRNAILALIPLGGSPVTSTSILYLKLSPVLDPVIAIGATGAIVSVDVDIEVFLKNADGSIFSVLVVRSSLSLAASISVISSRLNIVLTFSKNTLVLISSGVGITDVSSLVPHCGNLLGEIFVPFLNGPLALGIQLPSLLGVPLVNVSVQFGEGALLLYI